MAFPTLSVNPEYPIEERLIESSIKSDFEAGYVLARSRHSRNRKTFNLNYRLLDSTDKGLLKTHIETVKDIDSFTWTHPVDSTSHTVRYQSIPAIPYVQYGRWNCSFILEEV